MGVLEDEIGEGVVRLTSNELVLTFGSSYVWDPYSMHRGGCLELYYCNMVEWCWWDSSLI